MSGFQNSTLQANALELADEIREGRWRHVAEWEEKVPSASDEIVGELRARCPGFERAEYEVAIAEAMLAEGPSAGATFLYWVVACTCIWAFFGADFAIKKVGWGSGWLVFFLYPVICGGGAFYLLTTRRGTRIAFALLNAACGIGWIIYLSWLARAFARSFLK